MRGDSDKKIHSCADVLTKEAEEEGLSSSTAAQTAVLFSLGGEVGLAGHGVPPFPPLRPTPVFDPINMQDFIFLPLPLFLLPSLVRVTSKSGLA